MSNICKFLVFLVFVLVAAVNISSADENVDPKSIAPDVPSAEDVKPDVPDPKSMAPDVPSAEDVKPATP